MELVHDSALHPHEIDEKWFSVQEIGNLIGLLRAEGVPCEELLQCVRLADHDLQDAHKRVSARQRIAAYQYAATHSRDPTIALRCGGEMRLASYGIWGIALLCCVSLREVLDMGFRYLRLAGPLMRKSMYVTDDRVIFRAEDSLLLGQQFPFALEVWWASIHAALKSILASDVKLSSLSMAYAKPDHWRAYESVFGCPVAFGAQHCDLVFPRSYLSAQPVQANVITAEVCEELCSRMLGSLTQSDLVTRIRQLLLATPRTCASLDDIAGKVHMSPRSLRRKLKSEGTSYQLILGETRASLAKEYLLSTDLSLAEVAHLVGFSSPANFQSAFKKWVSHTPAEFRKGKIRRVAAEPPRARL